VRRRTITYNVLSTEALLHFADIADILGEPIQTGIITVLTASGVAVFFHPSDNPALLADLARDGVHHLTCPGCRDCT
jgi:hypothetical protein